MPVLHEGSIVRRGSETVARASEANKCLCWFTTLETLLWGVVMLKRAARNSAGVRFSAPLESWEMTTAFRGVLAGCPDATTLHTPRDHPPVLLATETLLDAVETEDGSINYTPTHHGTAVGIPTGMRVELRQQAVFGPKGPVIRPLGEPRIMVTPPPEVP